MIIGNKVSGDASPFSIALAGPSIPKIHELGKGEPSQDLNLGGKPLGLAF